MDAIRDAINNVSLYEVKAAVRKAQNGIPPGENTLPTCTNNARSRHELHRDGGQGTRIICCSGFVSIHSFSTQVREATNNEPWGASSTLMNEIASGTYN